MAKDDLIKYASTPRQREAVMFLQKYTWKDAARAMGICSSSFSNLIQRCKRARRKAQMEAGKQPEPLDKSEGNTLSIDLSQDDGSVIYVGDKFTCADDLLEHANIDRNLWDVVNVEINSWEVSGKRKMGLDSDGLPKPEQLWQRTNLQIKVKLRRKAPKYIQDAIGAILSRAPAWRGKLNAPKHTRSANHLLEIALYDSHFGKLCWGAETGSPYDLSIAYSDYIGAVQDALLRVSGNKIEKIVFPIGHDFFNVDNWQGTTAKGTRVDSTDDRFQKVFQAGYDAVSHAAMLCREVAPVEFKFVPGNHDPATSWYLCEMLRRVFEGDRHITVDVSPSKRKYELYGITLLGYDHGDTIRMEELPLLMAAEVPDLWSKSVYRSWRIGHFHKTKEMRWRDGDTFKGVDVKILPSISGTDKWHYDQGYVGNMRAAEAALWCKESGPAGFFPIEARSATKARKAS